MLKLTVAVFFGFSLLFPTFQPLYGEDITYETLTPLKWGPPNVCVFEPNYEIDPVIDDNFAKVTLSETQGALDQWESLLKEKERRREDQSRWDINYVIVKIAQQPSFDMSNCSVLIQFLPVPKTSDAWLTALGTTENKDTQSKDLRVILVFYKKIDRCVDHEDQYYIYYKACYIDEPILAVQLGNTVRHEFGHAIGLGHYYMTDSPNAVWTSDRGYPSIMAKASVDTYYQLAIRQIDIDKVREIYGVNGFRVSDTNEDSQKPPSVNSLPLPSNDKDNLRKWVNGKYAPTKEIINSLEKLYALKKGYERYNITINPMVPDWLKNPTRWWLDGKITDDEFFSGIEYLGNKGIIDLKKPW